MRFDQARLDAGDLHIAAPEIFSPAPANLRIELLNKLRWNRHRQPAPANHSKPRQTECAQRIEHCMTRRQCGNAAATFLRNLTIPSLELTTNLSSVAKYGA